MPRRFSLITPETVKAHRMTWWAIPFGRDPGRIRRNPSMRARDWGWDVTCSCGWESRTGGAIQSYVQSCIDDHRYDAQFEATHTWNGTDWVEKEVVPNGD
jgi:hypothetical protein